MTEQLLVLEDIISELRGLKSPLQQDLYFVTLPVQAQAALHGKALPQLVVADFADYGSEKMRLLQDIRGLQPAMPMIALVGFGDDAARARLWEAGFQEVLMRPVAVDVLEQAVRRQLKILRMHKQIARMERQAKGWVRFTDVIGSSAVMRQVVALGEQVAVARKHALIEGAGGTGKALLARAIHGRMCPEGAFVTLDCEYLPEQALERLFSPAGLWQAARGGVLFIREVGQMPPELQQALLERMQREDEGVRVLASSSVALEDNIRKGEFSHGLYRLLRQGYIPMPSLEERKDDIALLAQHFLDVHTARVNKFIRCFSEDALKALTRSHWPGNVAQLSALVYRCCMLCNHDMIDEGTLRMVQQLEPMYYTQMQLTPRDTPTLVDAEGRIKKLKSIEEEAIRYALMHYGGSMTKAAASLGIGRSTLYRRMMGKDQMVRANQTTRPMMAISSSDFS